MALTMIDPASSWFEVVELPTIMRLMTKKVNGKERTIEEEICYTRLLKSGLYIIQILLYITPLMRIIYDF